MHQSTDQRRKLGYLAIFILGVHFLISFLYVAPESLTGIRLKHYAAQYMLPLFHQNWDLFAPIPPQKNYDVVVHFNDGTSRCISCELLDKHHTYRLGISGRASMALQNMASIIDEAADYGVDNLSEMKGYFSEKVYTLIGTGSDSVVRISIFIRNLDGTTKIVST